MATPEPTAVLVATRLEAWAARREIGCMARVERVGVGAVRRPGRPVGTFVSCGLAGGLAAELAPGTVLVPDRVVLAGGGCFVCHPPLVRALVAAARALGYEPCTRPLVTTSAMVVGPARRTWARRGFAAADMETGRLLAWQPLGAAVRVVLDSPTRDVSGAWARPARALADPRAWYDLAWLAGAAPRYALRAARVAATALGPGGS
jgi:hypothetical protein